MREALGIDIVTRLYDLADLPHLDRLIFSIMGQTDAAPMRLHVMLPHFSFIEVQTIREAIWGLRQICDRATVMLHNWDYPAPFDLRVPLLNWGLDLAQGRYVTCLDVHEQLCPQACTTLLVRLRSTQAALALGGVVPQPVSLWGNVFLPVLDEADGSTPTPVFMADRYRLAVKDCVFRNGEPDSEIKEFIERIGTQYTVDTICQRDTLALRMRPL